MPCFLNTIFTLRMFIFKIFCFNIARLLRVCTICESYSFFNFRKRKNYKNVNISYSRTSRTGIRPGPQTIQSVGIFLDTYLAKIWRNICYYERFIAYRDYCGASSPRTLGTTLGYIENCGEHF